ncbi:MAG: undecaprenyl-diphosphate phosphatase [bacterium]|nr:undecaprenyl-diphosphate phosphatase [bacterium]
MTIFQSLILGIVQGLTEFLPVSSSGHLVLFQSWFGFSQHDLFFDLLLHMATLGAVFIFFFPALKALTTKKIGLLVVGSIPAAVVGMLFKSQIEMLFASVLLVAVALLVTASINFGITYYLRKERAEELSWKRAFFIGCLQAIAITPGISRSGSTIFAGLKAGLSREKAFEFSFLLSIPAIGGATLLQLLDMLEEGFAIPSLAPLVVGFVAAFITGWLSLGLLKKLLVTSHFNFFGWYTASVAVVVLAIELLR